jgi:mRNA-degrading endonuclease toxin of MazEF toxin-antitoxin module
MLPTRWAAFLNERPPARMRLSVWANFEVLIPAGEPVKGVVGADQVKSLDWRTRKVARVGTLSSEVVGQVSQRLQVLLTDGD